MNTEISNILFNFLPELTLAASIIILNISEFKPGLSKSYGKWMVLAGFLTAIFTAAIQAYSAPQFLFGGMWINDHFSYGAKLIILSAGLLIFLTAGKNDSAQYSAMILSIIGAASAVSSANLAMLFVSLEVMSIPLLMLLGGSIRLRIKCYIYSAAVSAMLLFGISLIYGLGGSMDYTAIARTFSLGGVNTLTLAAAMILVLAGLFFKAGLPLFNFIIPYSAKDSSYSTIGFLLISSALASVFALARFHVTAFHDYNSFILGTGTYLFTEGVNLKLLIAIISAAAIITGNFVMLWQHDLKRILVFFTISQSGLLAAALSASSPEGTTALLFYSIVFVLNTGGMLYLFRLVEQTYGFTRLEELRSLAVSSPFISAAIMIFAASAIGLPITAGFTGRLICYSALANSGLSWLAGLSILSSLAMIYFVFKLSRLLYSKSNISAAIKSETLSSIILLLLLLITIAAGVFASPFYNWAKYCSILIPN